MKNTGRRKTRQITATIEELQNALNVVSQVLNIPAASPAAKLLSPLQVSQLAVTQKALGDVVGRDSPHMVSVRFIIKANGGTVANDTGDVSFPDADKENAYLVALKELAVKEVTAKVPPMKYDEYGPLLRPFGLTVVADKALWPIFEDAPLSDFESEEDDAVDSDGDAVAEAMAEPVAEPEPPQAEAVPA